MDYLNDIISGVAILVAAVAAWFARRAGKSTRRQQLADVVRDACDYAKAHPANGISDERTAMDAARRLDLLDGKRDFGETVLSVAIKAELARRAA